METNPGGVMERQLVERYLRAQGTHSGRPASCRRPSGGHC